MAADDDHNGFDGDGATGNDDGDWRPKMAFGISEDRKDLKCVVRRRRLSGLVCTY